LSPFSEPATTIAPRWAIAKSRFSRHPLCLSSAGVLVAVGVAEEDAAKVGNRHSELVHELRVIVTYQRWRRN
jgi:hypothetical protein